MGSGRYFLTIKKNGRQIYHPTELRGTHADCRSEAIGMCERNEREHPEAFVR
jgi:hypothetical protein